VAICHGNGNRIKQENNLKTATKLLTKAIEISLTLPIQDKENKNKLIEVQSIITKGHINQAVKSLWTNRAKRIISKELKKAIWGGNKQANQVWLAETAGGSTYMPWARLVFKQGKSWKLPDLGLVSLMNKQQQVVVGIEKMEVILDYMNNQWAVKEASVRTEYNFQPRAQEKSRQIINSEITTEEVRIMARKLKRDKSLGSDLIPNEV